MGAEECPPGLMTPQEYYPDWRVAISCMRAVKSVEHSLEVGSPIAD